MVILSLLTPMLKTKNGHPDVACEKSMKVWPHELFLSPLTILYIFRNSILALQVVINIKRAMTK
jgi:hypothetical protein